MSTQALIYVYNMMIRLYFAVLLLLILNACEQRQAGGTTTEPFVIADLDLRVTTQSKELQAYIFNSDSPYVALDSAVSDTDGFVYFQSELALPAKFRISLQSETQGALLEEFNTTQLPSEWQEGEVLTIDPELEDYVVDTLSFEGSQVEENLLVQAPFEPYPQSVESGALALRRLPSQELWTVQTPTDTFTLILENDSLEESTFKITDQSSTELQVQQSELSVASELIALDFRLAAQPAAFMGKSINLTPDHLGQANQAVSLDSIMAAFDVPDALKDADFYSIDFWVKPECPTDCGIMGTNDTRNLMIINNRLQASTMTDLGVDVMTSNTFLTNGTWYHVVYQYNRGELAELYIDGTLSTLGAVEISPTLAFPTILEVGRTLEMQSVLPDVYFRGEFGAMRWWNRKLSSLEVTDLYQGILPQP